MKVRLYKTFFFYFCKLLKFEKPEKIFNFSYGRRGKVMELTNV